jgi:thiamine-phosphate pyrophosphorylase
LPLPRFYPILDTARFPAIVPALRQLLDGGALIVQIRHKGHWSRALHEQAIEASSLCRQANATLVINDRADIAALLACGLHVGQDDLPPADARRLVTGLLGFSTHNEHQLREAAALPTDYLALGPIFGTASKVNPDPVVGLDNLKRWRPLSPQPLVAIGGITRATALSVIGAGADSIAVIGDLDGGRLEERTKEWVRLLR